MNSNIFSKEVIIGLASALSLVGFFVVKKASKLNITDSPEPEENSHKVVFVFWILLQHLLCSK